MATHNTVIGVFADPAHARDAIAELKSHRITETSIGVAAQHRDPLVVEKDLTNQTKVDDGFMAGALAGAGVGGLWGIAVAAGLLPAIGPVVAGGTLAALFASAATGAAVAGLAGALVGMGIPEDEAKFYESEFNAGNTIVTVQAADVHDMERVVTLLQRHGAYDVKSDKKAGADRVVEALESPFGTPTIKPISEGELRQEAARVLGEPVPNLPTNERGVGDGAAIHRSVEVTVDPVEVRREVPGRATMPRSSEAEATLNDFRISEVGTRGDENPFGGGPADKPSNRVDR